MQYVTYSIQFLMAVIALLIIDQMKLMAKFDYLSLVGAQRADYKTVVRELWQGHVIVIYKPI